MLTTSYRRRNYNPFRDLSWRLVLMPPEGAPKSLHAKIAEGRAAALERLSPTVRWVAPSPRGERA